jgi:hypothetical protein
MTRCLWWAEFEAAVWPVTVVVGDVGSQDGFEMASPEDEDPVEAFASEGADPAFGVGVGLGVGCQNPACPIGRLFARGRPAGASDPAQAKMPSPATAGDVVATAGGPVRECRDPGGVRHTRFRPRRTCWSRPGSSLCTPHVIDTVLGIINPDRPTCPVLLRRSIAGKVEAGECRQPLTRAPVER